MFFHSWADIGRVVVTTAISFAVIVGILRVVGSQAIAQMSGYDMIATVMFGSIVATSAITRGVTISEGVAAILTLIVLQETIRYLQSRWLPAHHAVRQKPVVLLWEGTLLEDRLRSSRISVVVLENDGGWSVIPMAASRGDDSALDGLPIPGPGRSAQPTDPRRVP
jgi:uncharacterized membrane protein YcaP (DUF421 family)